MSQNILKYTLLFLLTCITLSCKNDKAPGIIEKTASYPPYIEVVDCFLKNNKQLTDDYTWVYRLHFQKTRNGWESCMRDYDDKSERYTYNNRELIWDADSVKYTIPFTPDTKYSPFLHGYVSKNPAEWYNYERIPYQGYDTWAEDVIADFSGLKDLNDTLTEGLARAYADYANSFLWNQYNVNKIENDSLRTKLNAFEMPDDARIAHFTANEDKAIALYKQLKERNPNYQTFVGNIDKKYFYENIFTYLMLSICGKTDVAAPYLTSAEPPQLCLNEARNLLATVEPNAILFTYGDGDYLPLIYLQKHENYRTDIKLINISLLAGFWYINYLSNQVKMDFIKDIYGATSNYYFISSIRANDSDDLSLRIVMETLLKSAKNGQPVFLKADAYYIEAGNEKIPLDIQHSVYTADLALYDIIQSNFTDCPIYSTNRALTRELNIKYFVPDGCVFKLATHNEEMTKEHTDLQKEILLNTGFVSSIFLENYMYNLSDICTFYIKNQHIEDAKELVQHFADYLQNNKYPTQYISGLCYSIIPLMYQLDFTNEARLAEGYVFKLIEENASSYKSTNTISTQLAQYCLHMLKEARIKHNNTIDNKDINNLLKRVESI